MLDQFHDSGRKGGGILCRWHGDGAQRGIADKLLSGNFVFKRRFFDEFPFGIGESDAALGTQFRL